MHVIIHVPRGPLLPYTSRSHLYISLVSIHCPIAAPFIAVTGYRAPPESSSQSQTHSLALTLCCSSIHPDPSSSVSNEQRGGYSWDRPMGNKPPELYYDILHVARDASPQRVRAAYRSLVRQWHPDKHPPESRPAAEARFKVITEAYEVTLTPHRQNINICSLVSWPQRFLAARVVAPTISCCGRARWR